MPWLPCDRSVDCEIVDFETDQLEQGSVCRRATIYCCRDAPDSDAQPPTPHSNCIRCLLFSVLPA